MDVGDEQIDRVRFYGPSERVRVVGIEKRKQSIRVDVEFLDGTKSGRRENVPGSRLHGPWSTVQVFDELRANWQHMSSGLRMPVSSSCPRPARCWSPNMSPQRIRCLCSMPLWPRRLNRGKTANADGSVTRTTVWVSS